MPSGAEAPLRRASGRRTASEAHGAYAGGLALQRLQPCGADRELLAHQAIGSGHNPLDAVTVALREDERDAVGGLLRRRLPADAECDRAVQIAVERRVALEPFVNGGIHKGYKF